MIHQGNLLIQNADDLVRCAEVTEVTGDLSIHTNASVPLLTKVSGGLAIHAAAALPALTTVGESLYVYATVSLPALTTVGEDVNTRIYTNVPALTTVGEGLVICADFDAPSLVSAHGVHGHLLCVSTYGLWLGDNGLLYAGCQEELTVAQALKHWDRQDDRAIKFTAAIKALQTN